MWINVTLRLPPEGVEVVWLYKRVGRGKYKGRVSYTHQVNTLENALNRFFGTLICWMPLPPPPTAENAEAETLSPTSANASDASPQGETCPLCKGIGGEEVGGILGWRPCFKCDGKGKLPLAE